LHAIRVGPQSPCRTHAACVIPSVADVINIPDSPSVSNIIRRLESSSSSAEQRKKTPPRKDQKSISHGKQPPKQLNNLSKNASATRVHSSPPRPVGYDPVNSPGLSGLYQRSSVLKQGSRPVFQPVFM